VGKYHCTIDLLFDWVGIGHITTDNFCFYLHKRLIQTSQTGGQRYSDTSLFSIPWFQALKKKYYLQAKFASKVFKVQLEKVCPAFGNDCLQQSQISLLR
jgi:hypothetical protein